MQYIRKGLRLPYRRLHRKPAGFSHKTKGNFCLHAVGPIIEQTGRITPWATELSYPVADRNRQNRSEKMKQIEKIWFITGCSSGLGVRNGKSRPLPQRSGRSWRTGLRNSAPGRIPADSLILQYKLKDFLHTPIFWLCSRPVLLLT